MVVGAPDVDEPVIAALELVVVVGDVRGEIGQAAVGLAQHAVLVVAQGLGGEPEGTVLVEGVPGFGQGVEGGLDGAALHQGLFREPVLVFHAEVGQVGLDAVQDLVHGAFVAAVLTGLVFHVGQAGVFGQHLAGDVDDVAAAVVVLRPFHGTAGQFLHAQPHGKAQDAHLATGVVDVVFGLHVEAGLAQQAGQAVAHGGAAAVAHVQGAGGVGGNVFHQGLAALAHTRSCARSAG